MTALPGRAGPLARWGWRARILAALLCCASVLAVDQTPARAASSLRGSGSTYVGLAMQNWVNQASSLGLRVDYLPKGSPDGLQEYAQNLTNFAGTEAEYSAIAAGGGGGSLQDQRGYQYVPDIAGAIAVMYNVEDTAGRKINYLRLAPRTVARIFVGDITRWSDPAIAEDNAEANLRLPDEPITVVFRSGRSGTTALFYDFVANVAPDLFGPWAARFGYPDNQVARIIDMTSLQGNFAPKIYGLNGSDQIAQTIAGGNGKWMIGYDEFGYAKVYGTQVARIRNTAGRWVLPYAVNITAALESARLRPDLTQELSGVYASANPDAYPLSAYSYLVTQCAPTGDRPTCKGGYADGGVASAMAQFMRMIACDGQVEAAALGYSPLPPNLSQEMANSIGRMLGQPPEQLNAGNCSNPRFRGNDPGPGGVAPPDPVEQRRGQAGGGAQAGGAGVGAAGNGPDSTAAGATQDSEKTTAESQAETDEVAAAIPGRRKGAGAEWLTPEPVVYDRPAIAGGGLWLVLVLLLILVVPTAAAGAYLALRRPSTG